MSKCKKCGGNLRYGLCRICEMLEAASPPGGTCTGWPMKSMAMGVGTEQVQEANEHLAASGISSREAIYLEDGSLELQSKAARKKVMKAKGMTDLEDANTKH